MNANSEIKIKQHKKKKFNTQIRVENFDHMIRSYEDFLSAPKSDSYFCEKKEPFQGSDNIRVECNSIVNLYLL